MMQIAFYKAPGTWIDGAIRLVTRSKYSHCEVVIDGVCWSASIQDGGIRQKRMLLNPERWDVVTIPDSPRARQWFLEHEGQGYDFWGVFRFLIPFVPQREDRWFCSEASLEALRDILRELFGGEFEAALDSSKTHPGALARIFGLDL